MTSRPPPSQHRWLVCHPRAGGVLVALALFAALEVGLRVVGFEYRPPRPDIILTNPGRDAAIEQGTDHFQRSARSLWELRPGSAIPSLPEDAPAEVIGPLGFRGWNPAPGSAGDAADHAPIVACLGDSSTYGVFLPLADTMPVRLQEALRADFPTLHVLNAGCVGYSVAQGYWTWQERLRPLGVEVLVLSFGCVNDSLPSKFYDDEAKREQVRQRGSAGHRWLDMMMELRVCQLLRQVLPPDEPASLMEWLSERGQDVPKPDDRAEGRFAQRVAPARFEELLEEWVLAARAEDVGVVLVSPSRVPSMEEAQPFLVQYSDAVRRVAARLDVPFLDFRSLVRSLPGSPSDYHQDDVHPNADGQRRWAEALAPLVRDELRRVRGS